MPRRAHSSSTFATIQRQRGTRQRVFWIVRLLVRGFGVLIRVAVFHSQLIKLTSLFVLQQPERPDARGERRGPRAG
jgi:hypothetical protein